MCSAGTPKRRIVDWTLTTTGPPHPRNAPTRVRPDGENGIRARWHLERRRQHERAHAGRDPGELVDRADAHGWHAIHRRSDRGGDRVQHLAAEPVAVALDHRQQAVDLAGHPVDVIEPGLAADGEAQRHVRRTVVRQPPVRNPELSGRDSLPTMWTCRAPRRSSRFRTR